MLSWSPVVCKCQSQGQLTQKGKMEKGEGVKMTLKGKVF